MATTNQPITRNRINTANLRILRKYKNTFKKKERDYHNEGNLFVKYPIKDLFLLLSMYFIAFCFLGLYVPAFKKDLYNSDIYEIYEIVKSKKTASDDVDSNLKNLYDKKGFQNYPTSADVKIAVNNWRFKDDVSDEKTKNRMYESFIKGVELKNNLKGNEDYKTKAEKLFNNGNCDQISCLVSYFNAYKDLRQKIYEFQSHGKLRPFVVDIQHQKELRAAKEKNNTIQQSELTKIFPTELCYCPNGQIMSDQKQAFLGNVTVTLRNR